ncbi:MAG: class I SAM-dependent methyltransferase [Bacteroidales bacterium]
MEYDPIKRTLGRVFNQHAVTRKMFYTLLDVLLLRAWHVHRELRRFFKDHGQLKEGHILDAGSGFGQYTWYMARKKPSWTIHAIDVKEEEISNCRHFFARTGLTNTTFEVQDLTRYVVANRYHLILSVDVMEHIEEDRKVFANFWQSLQKDGMLLISTPSDQGGSDVQHQGDSSFIGEHVREGYSIEEITEKLQGAGFCKVEAHYTYGKPGSISWRLSMKYPILMLGTSKLFFLLLPFYYLLVMPLALLLNTMDVRMKHKSGTGLLVKAWK